MLTVSRRPDVAAEMCNGSDLLEGKCNRLSMQVRTNTEFDIWLKRLFAEIAHILGWGYGLRSSCKK
jgi:hypothetical protein